MIPMTDRLQGRNPVAGALVLSPILLSCPNPTFRFKFTLSQCQKSSGIFVGTGEVRLGLKTSASEHVFCHKGQKVIGGVRFIILKKAPQHNSVIIQQSNACYFQTEQKIKFKNHSNWMISEKKSKIWYLHLSRDEQEFENKI